MSCGPTKTTTYIKGAVSPQGSLVPFFLLPIGRLSSAKLIRSDAGGRAKAAGMLLLLAATYISM